MIRPSGSATSAPPEVTRRITDLEHSYVRQVLEGQFRTSVGSAMTKRLEQAFTEKFDSKYAISFVNGTATLHAALVAAGIGPGDEVIVPPLTMASTAFAPLHAGAVPIFADIDPDTWTLDPASVASLITDRTKAIIPVALYGLSSDMDPIMKLAETHGLTVVDDDAQCFLGTYKGRVVGSIAHLSSFSFQSSKHLTAGEGGMVTTNDDALAERVRRFNSLGYAGVAAGAGKGKITRDMIQSPDYARHSHVGFNYRMPELCAAVALAQTERMEEIVAWRIRCANLYEEARNGCTWLVPQAVPEGCTHAYWTYTLRLAAPKGEITWSDFRAKYMEMGGDGIYGAWRLNYLEPVFVEGRWRLYDQEQQSSQAYEPGLCPRAESIQPALLQFKTNYLDADVARRKADALAQTIAFFGS